MDHRFSKRILELLNVLVIPAHSRIRIHEIDLEIIRKAGKKIEAVDVLPISKAVLEDCININDDLSAANVDRSDGGIELTRTKPNSLWLKRDCK